MMAIFVCDAAFIAGRGRPKSELVLTDEERSTLESWSRRRKSAQALALRCRIVLLCADGLSNQDVAARLGARTWSSPSRAIAVCALLERGGCSPPRFGPRMEIRSFAAF